MLHLRFDKEDWQWQDAFAKSEESLASWEKHVYQRLQSFLDPSIEHFSFQTSGSTGKPKTISIHRKQIVASAQASLAFEALPFYRTHWRLYATLRAILGNSVIVPNLADCVL